MGVSTTTNRMVYAGDGSTLTFSFPYYFFKQADLVVYLYDTVAGGIVQQVLGTNYSISGTPNAQGLYQNGANIVMSVAPPSTSILVVIRSPSPVQNYALLQNGNISSTALVQQFDYLTLLIQRLEDQISRCVYIPDGIGSAFSGQLPNIMALAGSELAYLQVNQAANGITISNSVPSAATMSIPYTSLQTAGSTIHIPLFSLPPASYLTSLFIKHTTAFSGPSITDVVADIGLSGNYTQFINAFDIFQAVGDAVYDNVSINYLGSWANATPIYLTAVATGANLSALTAGSLNVYYSYTLL